MLTVPVHLVTHATPRTRLIELDLSHVQFSFAAGQAVMVGLHGSPLRKPYSIASAPHEVRATGRLMLLAQVDDSGALDPHLELAAPGTAIDLEGPFGTFGLRDAFAARPLLFVAGGTGIAPLRSMLAERLSQPRTAPIVVVYSARSADEFAFQSELDRMATTDAVSVHYTVTRDEAGAWGGRRGRIDAALLRAALPSPDACCLICGPPALVTAAQDLLRGAGVAAERILTERY